MRNGSPDGPDAHPQLVPDVVLLMEFGFQAVVRGGETGCA